MIYDKMTLVGEFLAEINIPCDLCDDCMCDGFCVDDKEYAEFMNLYKNKSQNGD